jgi:hypothetical protein
MTLPRYQAYRANARSLARTCTRTHARAHTLKHSQHDYSHVSHLPVLPGRAGPGWFGPGRDGSGRAGPGSVGGRLVVPVSAADLCVCVCVCVCNAGASGEKRGERECYHGPAQWV